MIKEFSKTVNFDNQIELDEVKKMKDLTKQFAKNVIKNREKFLHNFYDAYLAEINLRHKEVK